MIEQAVEEWVMRALEPYLDSTLTPEARRQAALDAIAAIGGQAATIRDRCAALAFNWPADTPALTVRTPGQQISAAINALEIDLP